MGKNEKKIDAIIVELNNVSRKIAVIPMHNNKGLEFGDMDDVTLKKFAGIAAYGYNKIINEMTERGLLTKSK